MMVNIFRYSMKIFLGIVLAFTCVSANQNLDDLINDINTKQNLWIAGKNFRDTPLSNLKGLLGAKNLPEVIKKTVPLVKHQINEADIPESFDSRFNWPKCKSIQEIRDQSACGSCWAVSVSSVISDRICIHSNATLTPDISARHLMTCDYSSFGCSGGYPFRAFKHWRNEGLVTGGAYGSKVGCQPYPFAPCEHHVNGPKPSCPQSFYDTPDCSNKCDNSSLVFNKERHYGLSVYGIEGVTQIQAEIMKNGPVTANFEVYEDFFLYKSGVYKSTSTELKGLHAVRIIGWGEEKERKYWLITNSWNEDWGQGGLFKILRGENECGIESDVYSGIPK